MNRLLKIIIPPIISILAIYGLLAIDVVNSKEQLEIDNDLHFDIGIQLFFILTILAILIQIIFTIPIWNKFQKEKKFLNLTLIQFFTILNIFLGTSFGFLFWARNFGIQDLLIACLIGIVLFSVYSTINLLTLNQLKKGLTRIKKARNEGKSK